ncbi:MAG: TlpA family protein disulfide reductase, partial [Streptococcus mitis]|nr:TlpA family protein disulfide reductase [Streptococcus mitis]
TQAFIDKEGKLVKTQPGFMDKDMILKELKEMG